MSDDFEMRLRLQRVAAYRELCRGVRVGGRENAFFAVLMLVLAYYAFKKGLGGELAGKYDLPPDVTDEQLIEGLNRGAEWLKSNFNSLHVAYGTAGSLYRSLAPDGSPC